MPAEDRVKLDVLNPPSQGVLVGGRSLTQSAEPIADYADTAGSRRKEHDTAHGTQRGDPAKAAEALITAVGSENPPYMLLLGNDASDGFRTALDALRTEVDEWEGLSRSTDFDA